MKTCLFSALILLVFRLSRLFYAFIKGVIKRFASFMAHLGLFFHILYEIFVLCIIYCMPQNSGGKCVLTKNIVKTPKIYGVIERQAEELWPKNHTINQRTLFCFRFDFLFASSFGLGRMTIFWCDSGAARIF